RIGFSLGGQSGNPPANGRDNDPSSSLPPDARRVRFWGRGRAVGLSVPDAGGRRRCDLGGPARRAGASRRNDTSKCESPLASGEVPPPPQKPPCAGVCGKPVSSTTVPSALDPGRLVGRSRPPRGGCGAGW